jgi:histidinol-phosphate aminotransferase
VWRRSVRDHEAVIRTRAALAAIPDYVPGRSAESVAARHVLTDVVKLASNEAPFGPLPSAAAAIIDATDGVNRYPDAEVVALRAALAARHELDADQVLVGNGSVELCRMAIAATCDLGDEVLYGWPSFEAYPILTMQAGATSVQVPLSAHRYDLDAMADALTDRTRVVFVCNPNNPTGTTVDRDDIERLLDRVPSDRLVVLDEAYREFVTAPGFPDGLELLAGRDNVCVMRTFSKAYGLAALRVGYAMAHESVISALRKVRVPFEVNALAQVAAVASLAADDEMRARVGGVIAERHRVYEAIVDLGLPVVASEANFLWLPIPEQAAVLGEYSERAGVVLRPFPDVGVRVTIGSVTENDRLLKVLRAASEDGAAG